MNCHVILSVHHMILDGQHISVNGGVVTRFCDVITKRVMVT